MMSHTALPSFVLSSSHTPRRSRTPDYSEIMRISSAWLCAVKTLESVVAKNLESLQGRAATQALEHNRFYKCFQQLADHSTHVRPIIKHLNQKAHHFDFNEVPANGFRSLLNVTDACLFRLIQTSRSVYAEMDYFLFRKTFHLKNLEEYTRVLGALRKMLEYAEVMMEQSEQTGSVFPKEGSSLIETWFEEVETLDQEVFYGKSLGFQYSPSVYNTLQSIALALAVCADTYRRWEDREPGSAKLATQLPNLLTTTRFVMKPHLRAKQIVHTTRHADINFCKQFWGLTEASYLQSGVAWLLPSVAVNKVITIPPEVIDVPNWKDGKDMLLKPATDGKPVYVRYISDIDYDLSDYEGAKAPLSPYLLFHCHGGGFIAQSSKAHECYLLKWAKDLRIPILSVDYALAPEYPYPKGLDEVVFAYAWALRHAGLLGWTGEKVCFVGDSAGGNLVVSSALKITCKGLKPPDGILAAYGAFLVQYTPSPSRLLCLMDPLLPMGILTRCLAAYAGIPEPTCVGQVQGADVKQKKENVRSMTPPPSPSPSQHSATSSILESCVTPGLHTQHSASSEGTASEGDATDAYPNAHPSKPNSHWFGKGMRSLFKSFRVKRAESREQHEEEPADPQRSLSVEEEEKMEGKSKVEPLPRFNFASVSVEDPFLSPLLADDAMLSTLPPVYLVACHLDPLLDDSISLARRLHKLKHPPEVHLDVMDKLPHGFLNFCLLSSEAAQATELCARRIREILKMDDEAQPQ